MHVAKRYRRVQKFSPSVQLCVLFRKASALSIGFSGESNKIRWSSGQTFNCISGFDVFWTFAALNEASLHDSITANQGFGNERRPKAPLINIRSYLLLLTGNSYLHGYRAINIWVPSRVHAISKTKRRFNGNNAEWVLFNYVFLTTVSIESTWFRKPLE